MLGRIGLERLLATRQSSVQFVVSRSAVLTADGALRVEPVTAAPDWSLELRWTGVGRGEDVRPVEKPRGGVEVTANRASYRRADGSEEWYLAGPLGVEQGFVVSERLAGEGRLVIAVDVLGLEPMLGADRAAVLVCRTDARPVLRYTDLLARDARGPPIRLMVAADAPA